jgi:hypothetical protein
MCFAWTAEQTAIISLYSINLSIFITEPESVYCAVRMGLQIRHRVSSFINDFLWKDQTVLQGNGDFLLSGVSGQVYVRDAGTTYQ